MSESGSSNRQTLQYVPFFGIVCTRQVQTLLGSALSHARPRTHLSPPSAFLRAGLGIFSADENGPSILTLLVADVLDALGRLLIKILATLVGFMIRAHIQCSWHTCFLVHSGEHQSLLSSGLLDHLLLSLLQNQLFCQSPYLPTLHTGGQRLSLCVPGSL